MTTVTAEPTTKPPEEPGLKANAIGFLDSLVIGLASTAPAYTLAAIIGSIVVIVGVQAPAALLLSFVPMFLIAGAFFYMNRADPDAGTTFSWVTRTLRAVDRLDRRLGGLRHRDPRHRLARGRRRPLHVPALRLGLGRRLQGRGHGARHRDHRRHDRHLHPGDGALGADPERDDHRAGRRAPSLRCRRPVEGVGRRRPCRLDRARGFLVQPVQHRGRRRPRERPAPRGLRLLGVGVVGQPLRGDVEQPARPRPCGPDEHRRPGRHLRLGGDGRRGLRGPRAGGRVRRRRRDPRDALAATCSGRPGTSSSSSRS